MKKDNYIDLYFVEGDTLPLLTGTLYQSGSSHIPQDMTGWEVHLHIEFDDEVLIKQGIITDHLNGKFQFQWVPNDLKAGRYNAEIQFTSPEGVQTANIDSNKRKLRFNISKQIA